MGGLFSAPKPRVVEATPQAAEAASVAANAATAAAAEDAATQGRRAALERARRGLSGTIATGERGVLAPMPAFATRKTLLGE